MSVIDCVVAINVVISFMHVVTCYHIMWRIRNGVSSVMCHSFAYYYFVILLCLFVSFSSLSIDTDFLFLATKILIEISKKKQIKNTSQNSLAGFLKFSSIFYFDPLLIFVHFPRTIFEKLEHCQFWCFTEHREGG